MRLFISGIMAALAVATAAEMMLVQPKDLAVELAGKGPRPTIFHVGPNFLYRGKHIPGSEYVGQGSSVAGLAALRAAAAKLPRDGELIVYCGCCPWDHCPNIKPAVELLKQMGFTRVKALYMETNFARDWTEKGYPVEAGTPKQ
ncbi:MAG TPA: hypothetical protein VLY04_15655 [Bryobacteraceae bacterium]|nr:hypothetical protein [Bryobacteraceae bacterium]